MKTVREAMTTNPRSVGSSTSVVEAARLMRDEHVGSLPVTEDGRLTGIITDRDIVNRVVAEDVGPGSITVGEVASKSELVTVEPDADLDEALRLMARHQVRRLPVVVEEALVGILAQADVAQAVKEKKVGELVEAISEPSDEERR